MTKSEQKRSIDTIVLTLLLAGVLAGGVKINEELNKNSKPIRVKYDAFEYNDTTYVIKHLNDSTFDILLKYKSGDYNGHK
jgi:hypothetical protein